MSVSFSQTKHCFSSQTYHKQHKKICKKEGACLNCVLFWVCVTTCRTGTEKMLPEVCICVTVSCLCEDRLVCACCGALWVFWVSGTTACLIKRDKAIYYKAVVLIGGSRVIWMRQLEVCSGCIFASWICTAWIKARWLCLSELPVSGRNLGWSWDIAAHIPALLTGCPSSFTPAVCEVRCPQEEVQTTMYSQRSLHEVMSPTHGRDGSCWARHVT